MASTDLTRAAANYSYLRGLIAVPAGAIFIASALANAEIGPFAQAWVFPVVAIAAGLACWRISRWYDAHYGRLSPSTAQLVRGGVAAAIAVTVLFGSSLLLRSAASWSLDLPVNAIAVGVGLAMLILYGIGVGLRLHHVLVWGGLVVVGAVPLWDGPDPSNVGLVLAGVATILCGLLDHRLFVQTFGAPGAAGAGEPHA